MGRACLASAVGVVHSQNNDFCLVPQRPGPSSHALMRLLITSVLHESAEPVHRLPSPALLFLVGPLLTPLPVSISLSESGSLSTLIPV